MAERHVVLCCRDESAGHHGAQPDADSRNKGEVDAVDVNASTRWSDKLNAEQTPECCHAECNKHHRQANRRGGQVRCPDHSSQRHERRCECDQNKRRYVILARPVPGSEPTGEERSSRRRDQRHSPQEQSCIGRQ